MEVGLERGRGRPRDSRSGDRRYESGDRRYESGDRRYGFGLVMFAFPLGVGALEVFYGVFVEYPEARGYFVDQVVVVGY